MGIIKFRGLVVYEGPLAEFDTHPNWNDSMAEYYPYASIRYVVGGEDIKWTTIRVDAFTQPEQNKEFEVVLDADQVADMNRIIKAKKDKEEAATIRMHKMVRVVRGRKVPIGTEGEVFWMGDSGYGMSVGLRLIDGKKVFTAMKNVETVQLDKVFEDIVLGRK